MSGPADASARLRRAILREAETRKIEVTIDRSQWTPWASVTFSGARHVMTITLPDSDAATNWLATLPETEFGLAGHLVADLVVSEGQRSSDVLTVQVEALTVEG